MSRTSTKSQPASDVTSATVEPVNYLALLGDDKSGFDAELVAQYKSATDNKVRGKIRSDVKARQDSATEALDGAQAKYWLNTSTQLRVDKAATERESVPNEVTVAQRIHDLESAAQALRNGDLLPSGIESLDMEALESALSGMSGVSESATKLATAKITRSVEKHSIGEVIERAFESDESAGRELLKISEVRRFGSVEGYTPSPGAIRAHLEGSNPIEGFELVSPTADVPVYSVRKVA